MKSEVGTDRHVQVEVVELLYTKNNFVIARKEICFKTCFPSLRSEGACLKKKNTPLLRIIVDDMRKLMLILYLL